MDSWEQEGKKFFKTFLLNEQRNLNQWSVTPESIPTYMKTFVGQPFIEEPNEEHFGAENMETWEILRHQEDYRKGTIRDVVYIPQKTQADVIVEVHDSEMWDRIQKGETMHVSPAIAGYPELQPDGTKVYKEWFGLHLARVKDPAYGVLHANIKQTCEGTERECVNRLVNAAAAMNISFNPLGLSPCELKKLEPPTPEAQQSEKDEKHSEMESKMSAFDTRLAAIEKSVSTIANNMKPENEEAMDDEEMESETAQYGNDKVGVPSHFSAKEKQKSGGSTASIATLQKQVASLQKQVAMYEEQDKSAMVDQLIGMMIEDEMAMDHEKDMMKESMMKEPKPMLASKLETAKAYHDRIASTKNTALASTPNRVVSIASAGGSNTAPTHAEMRELMP